MKVFKTMLFWLGCWGLVTATVTLPAMADPSWVIKATITVDQEVVQVLKYSLKTFANEDECKTFLASPDEQFAKGSQSLKLEAEDQGLSVEFACHEVVE